MVCVSHPTAKQGKCGICKNYKCCKPGPQCSHLHPRYINAPIIQLKRNAPPSSIQASQPPPQKRQYTHDDDIKPDITAIIKLLNSIPDKGYHVESIRKKGRTYDRAKHIHTNIIKALHRLLIPEDPKTCSMFNIKLGQDSPMFDHACDLYLRGDNPTSAVCAALMAKSFHQQHIKVSIEKRIDEMPVSVICKINKHRQGFGDMRFKSSRHLFKKLQVGKSVVNRVYPYRISPEKIATSIAYLQNQLPVIAGMTRTAKIDGYKFPNMSVYSLGGHSLMDLYGNYKELHPTKATRLGRTNFLKIGRLLCKKGEIRTGLSSYYVKLRDVGNIFSKMLDSIGNIGGLVGLQICGGLEISMNLKNLRAGWKKLEQFLSYEFRARHLKITNTCKSHCCQYALNPDNECTHIHTSATCMACNQGTVLLNNFESLIQHAKNEISQENTAMNNELTTMLRASSEIFRPTINAYLAHQVRAYAQFSKLKEETSRFTNKRCGLVFDHKQKILPFRFREGQVEYFGKRGMSLLGFMLIRRVRNTVKGVEVEGLSYQFYDVVVENYSSQDNVQVLSILDAIVDQIHEDFPEIDELMLGSDNASCLASHDNIPYIHYRNLRKQYIKIRNWIYTEACTGKGRIDTHFAFIALILKSFVLKGNDICTEEDIYNAMSSGAGLAGTSAVLFDGSKLTGKVFDTPKTGFKASKTGVRETHEMLWTELTPRVYTISNITQPEVVSQQKIRNYTPNTLLGSISKITKSSTSPLFIPTIGNMITNRPTKISTSTVAVTEALKLTDVGFGDVAEKPIEYGEEGIDTPAHCHVVPGWACYPKKMPNKALSLPTIEMLHSLFERGNIDKSRRLSAERARVLVVEAVARRDWYEQSILTEAKIKGFFGTNKTQQLKILAGLRNEVPHVEVEGVIAELEELEEAEEREEVRALQDANLEELMLDVDGEKDITMEGDTAMPVTAEGYTEEI